MSRVAATPLALLLGLTAAIGLASCGGSDAKLLPGRTAQEINANLATVRRLAAEGECPAAVDEAQQVSAQVDDLTGIDPKLKTALQAGAETLNEAVARCQGESAEEVGEEAEEETVTTETTPKQRKPGPEQHERSRPPAETPAAPAEKAPATPPYGKAKGHEGSNQGEGGEAPSGGIGPSTEVGAGH